MYKPRRIRSIAFALLIALTVLGGCTREGAAPTAETTPASAAGSTTTAGSSEASPPAAEGLAATEITGWFYPRYVIPGMEAGEFEQQLIDEFRAIPGNENVTINFETVGWDSVPEKVNIAISTGSTPDFLFDFPGRIIGYGTGGSLVDLTPYVSPETLADIPEPIWESCRSDGKLYMYPTAISYFTMAVNRKIFRDAGIEHLLPTNETRTWSNAEFENVLAELAKVDDLIAPMVLFMLNEQGDAAIRMMIQNQGADFINPEHTEIVLNSAEGKAGLAWYYDLFEKGYITKNPETLGSASALEMFMQSKAAITPYMGPSNLPTLRKMIAEGTADPDFDVMFMTQPTPDGTAPKVEAQVIGYCVFDKGDEARHRASAAFIEFTSTKPECVTAQSIFPIRNSMGIDQLGEDYDTAEHAYINTLSAYLGDTGYTANNYAAIRAAYYPQMQAIFTGQKTVEQGLDDFVAQANEALQQVD